MDVYAFGDGGGGDQRQQSQPRMPTGTTTLRMTTPGRTLRSQAARTPATASRRLDPAMYTSFSAAAGATREFLFPVPALPCLACRTETSQESDFSRYHAIVYAHAASLARRGSEAMGGLGVREALGGIAFTARGDLEEEGQWGEEVVYVEEEDEEEEEEEEEELTSGSEADEEEEDEEE